MISILIITYNRPDDLLELLNSINRLSEADGGDIISEVLVLNNNSSVDYKSVKDYLNNEFTFKHNYLQSEINLGVAKGRNLLVEKSKGELLLFLDDDICFDPFNLKLLMEINTDAYFLINNTGIITFDIRYFSNGEIQPSAFPHKKLQEKKHQKKFLTYYFTGAAHVIKRSVFCECGLYPTDFFYGMEEYDLSYRALDKGYSIGYSNSITFLHKESPLGRKPKNEQLRMMWVNKCKVAFRYLPKRYFCSTAALWSFQYLLKTRFDFAGWLVGWTNVLKIRTTEKRTPIKKTTLKYLREVEARLWY